MRAFLRVAAVGRRRIGQAKGQQTVNRIWIPAINHELTFT
jgi:hypothetical protein